MTKTYTVRSVEETWQVAAEVAALLRPGRVVALHGDLGAGKTTFVQGMGLALGLKRPVTSPTFTLSTEYQTPRFKLVHMDLYRLSGPDDLLTIRCPMPVDCGFCFTCRPTPSSEIASSSPSLHDRRSTWIGPAPSG